MTRRSTILAAAAGALAALAALVALGYWWLFPTDWDLARWERTW